MSRRSVFESVAGGGAALRAVRERVAILQDSLVLCGSGSRGWAEALAQKWELVHCNANRAVVPNDELLARVRSPPDLSSAGRENSGEPSLEQAVGDRRDLQSGTDPREEGR